LVNVCSENARNTLATLDMYHATQGIREKYSRSTELREYTECSLAWAACLVLV